MWSVTSAWTQRLRWSRSPASTGVQSIPPLAAVKFMLRPLYSPCIARHDPALWRKVVAQRSAVHTPTKMHRGGCIIVSARFKQLGKFKSCAAAGTSQSLGR